MSVVCDSSKNTIHDEFLDYGASFHMTACKDYFFTYHPCNGTTIYMADNSTCKIVGIGSVRITMSDGMTSTTEDVRYVPALPKNLLPLRKFDADG